MYTGLFVLVYFGLALAVTPKQKWFTPLTLVNFGCLGTLTLFNQPTFALLSSV